MSGTSFKFDKRLYTAESVRAAAEVWKDVAAVEVKEEDGFVVARCAQDARRLDGKCEGDFEGEFRNQALWEMRK